LIFGEQMEKKKKKKSNNRKKIEKKSERKKKLSKVFPTRETHSWDSFESFKMEKRFEEV